MGLAQDRILLQELAEIIQAIVLQLIMEQLAILALRIQHIVADPAQPGVNASVIKAVVVIWQYLLSQTCRDSILPTSGHFKDLG